MQRGRSITKCAKDDKKDAAAFADTRNQLLLNSNYPSVTLTRVFFVARVGIPIGSQVIFVV